MDLVILAELVTRIQLKKDGQEQLRGFHPVAVLLSYLTKAPLVRLPGGWEACWGWRCGDSAAWQAGRLGPAQQRTHSCWPTAARMPAPTAAWMPFTSPTHHHTHLPSTCARLPVPEQVPSGTPVVNALAKQRAMLENVFRACVGLPPENNMVRKEGRMVAVLGLAAMALPLAGLVLLGPACLPGLYPSGSLTHPPLPLLTHLTDAGVQVLSVLQC